METVAPPTPNPGPNGVGVSSPFVSMDPSVVIDYIVVVLEAMLGARREELEAPGSLLSKASRIDTTQRCQRFANESQVAALYVQKELISILQENGDADSSA